MVALEPRDTAGEQLLGANRRNGYELVRVHVRGTSDHYQLDPCRNQSVCEEIFNGFLRQKGYGEEPASVREAQDSCENDIMGTMRLPIILEAHLRTIRVGFIPKGARAATDYLLVAQARPSPSAPPGHAESPLSGRRWRAIECAWAHDFAASCLIRKWGLGSHIGHRPCSPGRTPGTSPSCQRRGSCSRPCPG